MLSHTFRSPASRTFSPASISGAIRFATSLADLRRLEKLLHRVRSERVFRRTSKVNKIRGLADEYCIVVPRGTQPLRQAIHCWLEDDEKGISSEFRVLLCELEEELRDMDSLVDQRDSGALLL